MPSIQRNFILSLSLTHSFPLFTQPHSTLPHLSLSHEALRALSTSTSHTHRTHLLYNSVVITFSHCRRRRRRHHQLRFKRPFTARVQDQFGHLILLVMIVIMIVDSTFIPSV